MSTAAFRPLSIAMLSHLASAEAPSGAEQSLALLARGLRDRGHEVSVVAPGPWALAGPLAEHGVQTIEIACRGCWMTYHDPRSSVETALRWARYAVPDPGAARLRRTLSRGGFDLVHVNCLPHLRGAAAGAAAGLPVVWHLREILPAGSRRRWFAARLARYASRIVAVSEATGNWVREEGLAGRVDVIPNGVPAAEVTEERGAARRALGLPESACVIGQFGQLIPHKGPLDFVRAARIAAREDPSLCFVLAGAGPQRFVDEIRREIGEETDAHRIRLLPPQPNATRLLAATDIVCLATRTPDPLPRSVLEGMAAGRPVIAFATGGTPEMVLHERTGWLVEPGNVAALARAFLELGRDEKLRGRLGAAGRDRAISCFSLDGHVERMDALFRRVVGR